MIKKIKSSLRIKVMLVIMMVVLLPLSVWAYLYYDALAQKYADNKIKNAQNALSQIVISMDNVMETYIKYSCFLADDQQIMNLVRFKQIDQEIVNKVMYYIRPWFDIIMYQNDYINSIRIIHNNPSLFNVNNMMYRDEALDDNLERIHALTPDMRFPKTAIEYCATGHRYPFTINAAADTNVWYIYSMIDSSSLKNKSGFIEIVVDNAMLCKAIADFSAERGESLQLADARGNIIFASGDTIRETFDYAALTKPGLHTGVGANSRYSAMSYRLNTLDASLIYLIPESGLLMAQEQRNYIFLAILIIIISLLGVSFLLSRLVLKKLLAFTNEIDRMDPLRKNYAIAIQSTDEIGKLVASFNQLIDRLHKAFERERELIYAQLTNQLKPHFICNAMDMMRIQAERRGQTELAASASQIGQYFRYSMMHARSTVSLANEISDMGNYIQLVNYLRENPIKYSISMDSWLEEHLADVQVPKLILQPIVENAVRHGLSTKTVGYIAIDLKKTAECIVITIEDNGIGLQTEQLKDLNDKIQNFHQEDPKAVNGLGLLNVKRRLEYQLNERSSIEIFSQQNVGTTVVLSIYLNWSEMAADEP